MKLDTVVEQVMQRCLKGSLERNVGAVLTEELATGIYVLVFARVGEELGKIKDPIPEDIQDSVYVDKYDAHSMPPDIGTITGE